MLMNADNNKKNKNEAIAKQNRQGQQPHLRFYILHPRTGGKLPQKQEQSQPHQTHRTLSQAGVVLLLKKRQDQHILHGQDRPAVLGDPPPPGARGEADHEHGEGGDGGGQQPGRLPLQKPGDDPRRQVRPLAEEEGEE